MFLLDTNIISELRRPDRADEKVRKCAEGVPAARTFISAITVLEIELGTLLIERKDNAQGAILRSWIDDHILPHFEGHESQYVLIGGAACELLMDKVGLDFWATKDLDIVLIASGALLRKADTRSASAAR
jgi:predicted nucleic acid-binding protein